MKKILIVIFGILLLVGCGSPKNNETDLKTRNLRGDVVFILQEDNGSVNLYFFNKNGMIDREISGMIDNKSFRDVTYNYQNGKLLTSTTKDISENGNSENVITYKYDKNGVLVSSDSQDYTNRYQFNEGGDKVEEVSFRKNARIIKEITTKYFYTNHSLDSSISVSSSVDNSNSTTKIYYERGRIKSSFLYIGDKISRGDKNEYDNNGNIFSETSERYYDNRTAIKKMEYEYSYDPKGNWIERKTTGGGDENEVIKRTLVYKGGDFSFYISKYESIIAGLSNGGGSSNNTDNSENHGNNQYQQNTNNQSVPDQWINCPNCQGTGKDLCDRCGGKGIIQCSDCNGKGIVYWKNPRGETCKICNGRGTVVCPDCRGKGNTGTCFTCKGTGQVLSSKYR